MPWKPDKERGTRTKRGYSNKYLRLRALVMARDSWQCQPCKRLGLVTAATECDHITPLSHGGAALDATNMEAICPNCHKKKTQKESKNLDAKGCAIDGTPNNRSHHWNKL